MWTNEMDRCLTKALVQQVKQGNKIDKSLSSSAYAAAVAVLNEKFALDLNKEHIRNRLKTWKKQYGVLKELLSQSEFQWDERQKIFVANDSGWNEYIKANPDSKASRPSFIENYNDWCMILGDYQPTVSSYRTKVEVDEDFPIDDEHVENADVVQICNGSLKEKGKNMMWTIEMDHCLTKTLVDLVRESKGKDKVLKNAVYAAAAATLNEKFGIDLMLGHVRNRLKTWKKRYGVLKELLSQSGFEWDETQKMVIANDSVWNEYVKTHPDAKAFRARCIENYDELCLIFGNDQFAESCSRNDAGLDSYLPAENEGVESVGACQAWGDDPKDKGRYMVWTNEMDHCLTEGDDPKEKGKYIVWTNEMDHCLTEILVDQVKKGNKKDKCLNNTAYVTAVKTLKERFSLNLNKDHVRNRLKTWKKQHGVLKELLSQTGFQWDDERKMVVAHDSLWNEYLKEHPDARVIRGKVIENYDELCIIFSNDLSTESHSRNGVYCEEHVEAADQFTLVYNDINPGDVGDGMEESSQQTRAQPASSSRSKRPLKRKRANNMMLETMSAMATNIGRIADALGQHSKTVNLDELFDVVQKIPGFDDDLIIEACEYLSVDEKKAKMFLKLDDRLRRLWLLKRLHGRSS
ncbi:L10-interacting MYB domain-containing protein-like isoform X2 [Macadamia integrifolia]|nr:L10-interacting MYB domain-containing protein-like isoform X2 [Macadamia integrifolia]XP_042483562.1 L10-interacting MYB domain-containing protein-like isoform X2 [Macadamia integrifolia]XP_042483563.1 L10-interacting MYB domain-containing protein-like isoform X2 [Macadamia integrifolia]XP_042483564.1 L10-interacting MYB domain-containing protein-like isoform X2 [Macadamia integrifolia]XP_042483565.1 L10-interacting MYB domain-containing protein-like isoform X2 [Macadamia integrifolia]